MIKKLRDAVHDLNNLLASIVGYAEFFAGGFASGQRPAQICTIHSSGRHRSTSDCSQPVIR